MQNPQEETQKQKLSIGEAANYLGISIDTLRRWDKAGKVKSARSPGGHRYFEKTDLDQVFGKRYERYSTKKLKPVVNENKDQFTSTVVEEKPEEKVPAVAEIVEETPPVVELINESPQQLPEEPVVTQPEKKPTSSYAVVEQLDQPIPPKVNSFANLKPSQEESEIVQAPPEPLPEPISAPPETLPQLIPTLKPEERLPNVAPATQPQVENTDKENKSNSKLKPIIIFLVVFAVIDIILLIVYFVTSRPIVSPIS